MELTDLLRAFESGDFARPNLFEVEIPYLGKNFSFKAKATAMPAANVDKIAVGYQNRKLNVAGDRTYDDWNVTIYNDDKHEIRELILAWQNMCHARGAEITGDTPAEYKKSGVIRQFGRDAKTITKEVQIFGMWPSVVGEVSLDWDTNSEVETFECTFVYDYWE